MQPCKAVSVMLLTDLVPHLHKNTGQVSPRSKAMDGDGEMVNIQKYKYPVAMTARWCNSLSSPMPAVLGSTLVMWGQNF